MSKKLLFNSSRHVHPQPQNPIRDCTVEARNAGIVLDPNNFTFELKGNAVYPIGYVSNATFKENHKSRIHFRLIENSIPTNKTFSFAAHYAYNETPKTSEGVSMDLAINEAIRANNTSKDVVSKWMNYNEILYPEQTSTTHGLLSFAVNECAGMGIIFQMYFEEVPI